MSGDKPEEGDKVSWTWGPSGTQPSGVVSEKKTEGEVSVESQRGNTITKEAKPNDPAIALERSGNPVVKNVSEVEVEEKNAKPELKDNPKDTPVKNGTKRKHDESEKNESGKDEKDEEEKEDNDNEDEAEENGDTKKETKDKKEAAPAEKKKAGRPAKAKENGEKKKPGRPPKDPNAPPASKKQKKEPREGTRKSSRLRN